MLRSELLSRDGVTRLATYRTSTENPRALLQISHGMCEHFLRYEGFAEYLSANGILVFGHDHLGHGATAPSPQELGFIAPKKGAQLLADDVFSVAQAVKKDYPDLPLVLLGHSMGSFIARAVLEKYPSAYTAAIVMGTAGPDMPTGAGKLLATLLSALFGKRHRSPLLRAISFAGYNKHFEKGCDPNAWLTRDAEVVRRYREDPLCGFVFTAGAYRDLFTLLGSVSRREWAKNLQKDLPLLLVSGACDPVGGYGKGVKKLADRLRAAGMRNLSLSLYPEMRHEILNEISYQTVWSDLLAWIQNYIK